MRRAALVVAAALAAAAARAQTPADAGVPVFEIPRFVERLESAARGEQAAAAAALAAVSAEWPAAPAPQAAAAAVHAARGDAAAAADALARAVALGFDGAQAALGGPAFAAVREDPRLVAAASAAPGPIAPRAPAAAAVRDGRAPVTEANALWRPETRRIRVMLDHPPAAGPVTGARERQTPAGRALTALRAGGPVSGHRGDVYDNRDGGHSALRDFPQLARAAYGDAARGAGLDRALNLWLDFDAVVIGNASLAVTGGPGWRSLPRLALATPGGAARLHQLYARNHLYVFPEHADHDPGRGDLLPAATPYVIVSQGSSGSDQPFVRALAYLLAALRPDVKARLTLEGLVAPTLQMLLRRSLRGVETDADYLGPAAHPAVFAARDLDLPAAIARAGRLEAADIPPSPRLAAIAEDTGGAPNPIFADGLGEFLFATPAAVARIARGAAGLRRYRLDASETADPNGRPLRFHWRLIRGDPDRVSIRPSPDGRQAEVEIAWSGPVASARAPDVTGPRVDVAVFADNGRELSAPAFFSLLHPPGRAVRHRADGAPLSIDYGAGRRAGTYADPALHPRRDWRDDYAYDADGRLTGWTRTRSDGAVERFDADGALIGSDGRRAPVAYAVSGDREQGLTVSPLINRFR